MTKFDYLVGFGTVVSGYSNYMYGFVIKSLI